MPTTPYAWIDLNNPTQLKWIADYLGRTQPVLLSEFMGDDFAHPERAAQLINAIKGHMDSPAFREQYGKLRNAWRQRKARERRDKKSATFMLPVSTLSTLERLAKQRQHTKVQTLCTIIEDAWQGHRQAKADVKGIKASHQRRLEEEKAKHQHTEQAYQRVVEGLLNAVAVHLEQRCSLEAKVGGPDDTPLEVSDVAEYEALVAPHLATLESYLTDLTAVCFKGESLTERLATLAQARKQAAEAPVTTGQP